LIKNSTTQVLKTEVCDIKVV